MRGRRTPSRWRCERRRPFTCRKTSPRGRSSSTNGRTTSWSSFDSFWKASTRKIFNATLKNNVSDEAAPPFPAQQRAAGLSSAITKANAERPSAQGSLLHFYQYHKEIPRFIVQHEINEKQHGRACAC